MPLCALACALLLQAGAAGPTDWQAEGLKALEAKNYALAIEALSKAVAADPNDYANHFNLALAYSLAAKDQQAIAEYRKTLQLKPGLPQATTNLAILLLRNNDSASAIPLLQQAHESRPNDARVSVYLGDALLAQNQLAEAAEAYASALRNEPKSAPAELGLAHVYARQGRLDDSAAHFRNAAAIDPSYKHALLELGDLY